MIKARGTTGAGQPLLVLGLSGENITRLMADEPIMFNLTELGLSDTVVMIVAGRTEADITASLMQNGLLEQQPGTNRKGR